MFPTPSPSFYGFRGWIGLKSIAFLTLFFFGAAMYVMQRTSGYKIVGLHLILAMTIFFLGFLIITSIVESAKEQERLAQDEIMRMISEVGAEVVLVEADVPPIVSDTLGHVPLCAPFTTRKGTQSFTALVHGMSVECLLDNDGKTFSVQCRYPLASYPKRFVSLKKVVAELAPKDCSNNMIL